MENKTIKKVVKAFATAPQIVAGKLLTEANTEQEKNELLRLFTALGIKKGE